MTIGDSLGPAGKQFELQGVSGWLLFLCIVLVVFIPIGVLIELIALWQRTRLSESQIAAFVVTAVDTTMLALAVTAGSLLYRLRRTGVWLARLFFALRLIIALVAAVENQTAEAVLAIVVSSAWLIYLFSSERVRMTYATESARLSEIFR